MVCDVIVEQAKEVYPHATIRQNQTVRIEGQEPLPADVGRLKPDIVVITENKVMIVEVSCPYDMKKDDGRTVLEHTFDIKRDKYLPLVKEVERRFHKQCSLHIVIVSSLGVVLKKCANELKALFGVKKDKAQLKTILKRISNASIIGSYLTYYKIGAGVEVESETSDEGSGNSSEEGEVESSGNTSPI